MSYARFRWSTSQIRDKDLVISQWTNWHNLSAYKVGTTLPNSLVGRAVGLLGTWTLRSLYLVDSVR